MKSMVTARDAPRPKVRWITTVGSAALALAAVTVAAAFLRLWTITGKGLWYDEAYSLFMARHSLAEMLGLLAAYDNHPPLYYAVLRGWMLIAGTGDAAVRLPSAAASLGAVLVTFLLARRLVGLRPAVLASAMLAISPFQVIGGQEARMYPLLTLLSAGASYAFWLALEDSRLRRWVTYAGLMVLAVYTHYAAALLVVAHGVYAASAGRKQATSWLRWTGVVALLCLPLLSLVWPQVATARTLPAFQHALQWRALIDLAGLLSFGGGLLGSGTYYQRGTLPPLAQMGLLAPFLFLAAAGLAQMGPRPRAFAVSYLLTPIAVTALVAIRRDVFQERYFSFVQPAFAIMVAAGMAVLMGRRGLLRILSGIALTLVLGLMVAGLVEASRDPPSYDWRGAGRYLTAAAASGDVMLYVPPFIAIPFEHYYQGQAARPRLTSREILDTAWRAARGQLRLRSTVPVTELPGMARAHRRIWIISSGALGPRVPLGIAEVMSPHFRQAERREFGLVTITLWESRF